MAHTANEKAKMADRNPEDYESINEKTTLADESEKRDELQDDFLEAQEDFKRMGKTAQERHQSILWPVNTYTEFQKLSPSSQEYAWSMLKAIMKDYLIIGQASDATIAERNDAILQLQEEIQDKDEKITELQGIQKYLENTAPIRNVAPRQSAHIPDPPILTDGIEPAFEDWVVKIRLKLEANIDHFPNDKMQMSYLQSRLAGLAVRHVNPRLHITSPNMLQSAEEILQLLKKVFSDPGRHTAQTEYHKLYQGKNTFATFWAEFQRLTAELDYSEETLLDDLRFKINQSLQKALVAEVGTTTLHEFAKKCMLVDQNLQRIQEKKKRIKPQPFAYQKQSGQSPTTSTAVEIVALQKKLYRHPHQDPEKESLMKLGKCFHCHGSGHRARNCPQKQKVRVNEISITEEHAQYESGNE
ncbi:hypothetical protein GMDG_08424 [Pseudogymnoascus destructans 20631-21]|uniref:CCHC-type domain-containing protein n=1 Tax=Pseudogymnoascus destructans (strain ATCC MYA-4855 / 20631-21) TaxID=658429 RepID=L8G2G3_PSED2|nr:hypothetical protein GMDG_08424 [Pseudogymnoascus destructans 20631-21]